MIFSKVDARLITRGKKTMLLAPARPDQLTGRHHPPKRYRVGTDIGVQPAAGASELCRIQITGHTLIRLVDLDFAQARCLGFRTRADLASDWLERHDPEWPPLEEALCAMCDGHAELHGDTCPGCEIGVVQEPKKLTEEQILEQFADWVGDRQAWLVTFTVPDETPRMLAAHSEKGYTTRRFDALPDEPEALDERTQQRYSEQARTQAQETDLERRRRLRDNTAEWVAARCDEMGISDPRSRTRILDAVVSGIRKQHRGAA